MQHNHTRFALTLGAALGLYAAAPSGAPRLPWQSVPLSCGSPRTRYGVPGSVLAAWRVYWSGCGVGRNQMLDLPLYGCACENRGKTPARARHALQITPLIGAQMVVAQPLRGSSSGIRQNAESPDNPAGSRSTRRMNWALWDRCRQRK